MAEVISDTSLREDPVLWVEERLYAVFGRGTPREQMQYSFFLGVLAWFSSAVTLGLTLFLAFVFTGTFFWGLGRYAYAGVTG